ncbi:transposable element Tc3 transposase [Trichonephila clavipes]|nr:transposable element Tc3 transposase [Trichonephila clavipes]
MVLCGIRIPDFHKRILLSDEAHFWLNGYVNKQNCRIWSEANPQVYVETPLHPEKLTVWCALWAGGIIGPYFFKFDEGKIGLHPSQPWHCQVIYSQFGLANHQNDHQARRRFVEWAQNEIAVVSDFHKRILFSDEAHFWLNGYVNKQNCRIWSEANPQVYVETLLHPEKLTVWCALWAGGVIGPYFFKNDEGHNVTVNGDRYRAMITNFFIPELNIHDVQELWFQQGGATCHTARATIDLLKDTFGDRLISRFGPVNWPPTSCDLTPLDYFLWGYVKSLVYADKPQTLDHLEDNIRRYTVIIADIRPQMLEKVIENWTSRLDYIRASRGSHMPEIIFKM